MKCNFYQDITIHRQILKQIILLVMAFFSKTQSLWKEGEVTNPFVSPDACISREKRFKHFSIYWPEKSVSVQTIKKKRSTTDELAQKISRLIDEEEKNEMRISKANGSLKKLMSKTTGFRQSPRETFSNFRPTTTSILTAQNQKIVNRLTLYEAAKQSKLRDRHGNRANLIQNQEQQIFNKLTEDRSMRGTEKGFYTSHRLNLNLPSNYYPGPGTYEIKRYLQGQKSDRIRSGSIAGQ